MKNQLVISKNYRYVNRVTFLLMTGKVMESLNQFVNSLAQNYRTGDVIFITMQSLAGWIPHCHPCCGRIAAARLFTGAGREVVNESSRMGLPDELTLHANSSALVNRVR